MILPRESKSSGAMYLGDPPSLSRRLMCVCLLHGLSKPEVTKLGIQVIVHDHLEKQKATRVSRLRRSYSSSHGARRVATCYVRSSPECGGHSILQHDLSPLASCHHLNWLHGQTKASLDQLECTSLWLYQTWFYRPQLKPLYLCHPQ